MSRIFVILSLLLATLPLKAQVFDDMAPDEEEVTLTEFQRDEESVVFVPKRTVDHRCVGVLSAEQSR